MIFFSFCIFFDIKNTYFHNYFINFCTSTNEEYIILFPTLKKKNEHFRKIICPVFKIFKFIFIIRVPSDYVSKIFYPAKQNLFFLFFKMISQLQSFIPFTIFFIIQHFFLVLIKIHLIYFYLFSFIAVLFTLWQLNRAWQGRMWISPAARFLIGLQKGKKKKKHLGKDDRLAYEEEAKTTTTFTTTDFIVYEFVQRKIYISPSLNISFSLSLSCFILNRLYTRLYTCIYNPDATRFTSDMPLKTHTHTKTKKKLQKNEEKKSIEYKIIIIIIILVSWSVYIYTRELKIGIKSDNRETCVR